ncbi:Ion transport protein-domain-containing protein [Globomyces pollinis-pini]|nr:Ion transport protein-domain-containing protein [Globomyces pollinis-pini]
MAQRRRLSIFQLPPPEPNQTNKPGQQTNNSKKPSVDLANVASNAFRDLSPATRFFRDKLIQEFNIIECLDAISSSSVNGSRYTTRDFQDPKIQMKLLLESPSAVIWFPEIKRKTTSTGRVDRRLMRTMNQSVVPIGAWAGWLISKSWYNNLVVIIIIVYSFSVAWQVELRQNEELYQTMLFNLDMLDHILISLFAIDIVLFWIDNIQRYFQDVWKICDFLLTLLIVFWDVIDFNSGKYHVWSLGIKTFAILKIIIRIDDLRTVVVTISQALQSMNYIIMFIVMMAIVYAHVGVHIFYDYVNSTASGLVYQDYFQNMTESLKTIFILLTLDQWDLININIAKISNSAVTYFFMISWTWVGAFIFRNIFVGVMIHNFKRITEKLDADAKVERKQKKMEKMKKKLKKRLEVERQEVISPNVESKPKNKQQEKIDDVRKILERSMGNEKRWEETVQETLHVIAEGDSADTYWPRDTMFQYLQLMETLMENLQEFQELNLLARKQLVELCDT